MPLGWKGQGFRVSRASLCRFKRIIPIPEQSMVQTLCHLLECLLTEEDIPADCPKDTYELYFVFAAIWAFGGAMIQDQVRNCTEADTHIQVHPGKSWSSEKGCERQDSWRSESTWTQQTGYLPSALLKTLVPIEGPYDVGHEMGMYLELSPFKLVTVDFTESCSVWVWLRRAISTGLFKVMCVL